MKFIYISLIVLFTLLFTPLHSETITQELQFECGDQVSLVDHLEDTQLRILNGVTTSGIQIFIYANKKDRTMLTVKGNGESACVFDVIQFRDIDFNTWPVIRELAT